MSTQINVAVGDQRLLEQNKTRSAANREALNNRTATKALEQKATEAVKKAAPDERPSGKPNTQIPRRPAANRKKEQPGFISVTEFTPFADGDPVVVTQNNWNIKTARRIFNNSSFLCPRPLDPALTYEVQDWTYTDQEIPYVTRPRYRTDTFAIAPAAYTYDASKLNTDTTILKAKQLQRYTSQPTLTFWSPGLDGWPLVYAENIFYGRTSCDYGGSTGTTLKVTSASPPFPLSYAQSPLSIKDIAYNTVYDSSVTGDFVTYISYTLMFYAYTFQQYTETVFGANYFVGYYDGPLGPSNPQTRADLTRVRPKGGTLYTYGVYYTINSTTLAATLTVSQLQATPDSTVYYNKPRPATSPARETYIQNMPVNNPRRAIYTETTNASTALEPGLNGLMYNPKTGALFITAASSDNTHVFTYKKLLAPNLSYYAALHQTALPIANRIRSTAGADVQAAISSDYVLQSKVPASQLPGAHNIAFG